MVEKGDYIRVTNDVDNLAEVGIPRAVAEKIAEKTFQIEAMIDSPSERCAILFEGVIYYLSKPQYMKVVDAPSTGAMREFGGGANRDTTDGKLDYVRALSPVVLRRYLQFLDKHRKMPDGTMRKFDNWKKGIPAGVYLSSLGRHFMDVWLLMHGFDAEDNHGKVELDDALCGVLFNAMGMLHEHLRPVPDPTRN